MRELYKTSRFSKDIKRMPESVSRKAYEVSKILTDNPFDKSLNIKFLTGYKKVYRVVILADYRMIYTFDETSVTLLRISHRKEIYKSLEL